jgi:hypothetical protein
MDENKWKATESYWTLSTISSFEKLRLRFLCIRQISVGENDKYITQWQQQPLCTISTDTLSTWMSAGVTGTASIKLQFSGTTMLWLVTTPKSPAISQCDVTVIAITNTYIQSLIKNIQFKTYLCLIRHTKLCQIYVRCFIRKCGMWMILL